MCRLRPFFLRRLLGTGRRAGRRALRFLQPIGRDVGSQQGELDPRISPRSNRAGSGGRCRRSRAPSNGLPLMKKRAEPQHADPPQATGARKRGDDQLHRFRVLESRIHSPPEPCRSRNARNAAEIQGYCTAVLEVRIHLPPAERVVRTFGS